MIQIYVGPTFISLFPERNMVGPINIQSFAGRKLTVSRYNPKERKWEVSDRFYRYIPETKELRIPRMYLEPILNELIQCGVQYSLVEIPPAEGKRVNLPIRRGWEDREHQVLPIQFLSNEKKHPMRCLQLQTGRGKTYCALKAAHNLGYRTLIISPGHLTDNWLKSVHDTLDIPQSEICKISGYKSIETLMNDLGKGYICDHYRVMVASIQTLIRYAYGEDKYKDLPPYREFLHRYGIGTKIVDECHLNFSALTQIDLMSEVPNNLYLSATYDRSDIQGNEIFHSVFNEEVRMVNDKVKYIDLYVYAYTLGRSVTQKQCMTPMGYNHAKYENAVRKKASKRNLFFKNAFGSLIEEHFLNIRKKPQKLLIFAQTIKMCVQIEKYLKSKYPDLVIRKFTGKDPESHLEDGVDIIVATIKSVGVGKDIKNLRTVHNTVSIGSMPMTEQMIGRLRMLSNGDTPVYIDMWNSDIDKHQDHLNQRLEIYRENAKSVFMRSTK